MKGLCLHEQNLCTVQEHFSETFYQIFNSLCQSKTVKLENILNLRDAVSNKWDREYFPYIAGSRCITLKSVTIYKLPEKLMNDFPVLNLYRAKVYELHNDIRGRFLALKRFYLTEPFTYCRQLHNCQHNYAVFVNDALYYHDLDAVLYQNEAFSRFADPRDYDFLIKETAFLCRKLNIYVPGYQQSAFIRSLSDYVNDLTISTVEGEVIHIDTRNNMQVKSTQGIFNLPFCEHSCQPSYLQMLLLNRHMKFIKVNQNTVSMRRFRNIHCAKLNTKIQKREALEGTIMRKNSANLVLDLGYGIRALLPIDKRNREVLLHQFQIGDTILVQSTQPIDAFNMNHVKGYHFFSLHPEIGMMVGIIVKFMRKGYKGIIIVALGIDEFVSVECDSTPHIYYGPGQYVILKRNETGAYLLHKSFWKQYVSFSYGPKADVDTVLGGKYQYYISFAYSEKIPADKLTEIDPLCTCPAAPRNLFYCVKKSLGPVANVTLPDFTGRSVNEGIDFCKKHGLASPQVMYIPAEDAEDFVPDGDYILEMFPGPETVVRSGHQVLFTVPELEISPFQVFQDEQVSFSSFTRSISQYLNIDFVFDEEWKILVLEFLVNHLCATCFQLRYYLKLCRFEKRTPLDKLLSRCLALNILIQCDIQNEHRRSVRAYILNPYVAKRCRDKVKSRIISHNVVYRLWDSVSIKAALSCNQAYLYLMTQYHNVSNVKYYCEFVQYIRPATAEKGFAKIHLCCVLRDQALLLFESIRDFEKTRYLSKNRLSYPREYIEKILRLDAFVAERSPWEPYKVMLYLLCETPGHQEQIQNEFSQNSLIQALRHVQLCYTNDMDTNLNNFNFQTVLFPKIDKKTEETEDDDR